MLRRILAIASSYYALFNILLALVLWWQQAWFLGAAMLVPAYMGFALAATLFEHHKFFHEKK